jgi:hypothetical protein
MGGETQAPRYQGDVTPLEQPASIELRIIGSLRGSFSSQREMTLTTDGADERKDLKAAGSLIAGQMHGKTTLTFDLMSNPNPGPGRYPLPLLLVQLEYDAKDQLQRKEFDGFKLTHGTPEEKRALNAYGEAFVKILDIAFVGSVPGRLIGQGDAVEVQRPASDAGKLENLDEVLTVGTATIGKMVGQTLHNGRRTYVLSVEGSARLTTAITDIALEMTGYRLVDAATGLYVDSHIRTTVVGKMRGSDVKIQVLSRDTMQVLSAIR